MRIRVERVSLGRLEVVVMQPELVEAEKRLAHLAHLTVAETQAHLPGPEVRRVRLTTEAEVMVVARLAKPIRALQLILELPLQPTEAAALILTPAPRRQLMALEVPPTLRRPRSRNLSIRMLRRSRSPSRLSRLEVVV